MQMKRQTRKEPTSEGKGRPRKGAPERAAKAPESDVVDSALALSTNDHAARLAAARSDRERAEITLGLQQAYGNAYAQRVVQARLTVSQPGDVYEQEADRVAADVTQGIGEQAQRMTPEEEEPPIQGKAVDSGGLQLSEDIETEIEAATGGGMPVAESTRSQMEPALGADFSGVRVHTDAAADRLARDLSAEAFTTGQDVFFRSGAYQPETEAGQGLLAHELTHVVQQQAAPAVQRDTAPGTEDELVEDLSEEMLAEPAEPAAPAPPAPAVNAEEQSAIGSAPTEAEPAPAVPAVPAEEAVPVTAGGAPVGTGTETATETPAESVTAGAPAPSAPAGPVPAASPQAAALRSIWDSVVVDNLRRASDAARARDWRGAGEGLNAAAPVVENITTSYQGQPAYPDLLNLRRHLGILWEQASALSGNMPDPDEVANGIDPTSSEFVAPLVTRIRELL